MAVLINILIVICIVACQTLEVYACFLKGTNSKKYNRQLVGLANWVQYVARINYVIVLFVLSYSFEVLNSGEQSLKIMSISFFISFIVSFLIVKYKEVRKFIHFILYPIIIFSYRDLVIFETSHKNNKIKLSKAMIIGFMASLLLGVAFVSPFLIAKQYPEYRMMATYSGQALNFLATAIAFSILEPIMYKELDKSKVDYVVCTTASSIIYAKLLSQLTLSLIIVLLI